MLLRIGHMVVVMVLLDVQQYVKVMLPTDGTRPRRDVKKVIHSHCSCAWSDEGNAYTYLLSVNKPE